MRDTERTLLRMSSEAADLEARVVAERESVPSDAALIDGIRHGTINDAALRYLARTLQPYLRARLLRMGYLLRQYTCQDIRDGFYEIFGSAALLCGHRSEWQPREDMGRALKWGYDGKRFTIPTYDRRDALATWLNAVEVYLVGTAAGDPTCMELRQIIDEAIDNGVEPPGAELLPSERHVELVKPLTLPGRACRILTTNLHMPR